MDGSLGSDHEGGSSLRGPRALMDEGGRAGGQAGSSCTPSLCHPGLAHVPTPPPALHPGAHTPSSPPPRGPTGESEGGQHLEGRWAGAEQQLEGRWRGWRWSKGACGRGRGGALGAQLHRSWWGGPGGTQPGTRRRWGEGWAGQAPGWVGARGGGVTSSQGSAGSLCFPLPRDKYL